MEVSVRPFTAEPGFTEDFCAVRDFLVRLNADEVRTPGFLWARWEWAFALPFQDTTALDRIGVWEQDGHVVGLATYEQGLGDAWLVVDPDHRDLLSAMVDHAVDRLSADGRVRILVPDDDAELAGHAAARGLVRAEDGEPNALLDLTSDLHYVLPDGYRTVSLADDWDLRAFHRLLHRGFGHAGEPDYGESELAWRLRSTASPSQRADLQVLVQSREGAYGAFCGVWLWPGSAYAMVEPVCSDPAAAAGARARPCSRPCGGRATWARRWRTSARLRRSTRARFPAGSGGPGGHRLG
ncbi:hypothetical protein [Cellulomonas fimi]|uniref:hypothetical protein n=1 Tax=Cellulomonas fimi TaxID=1708 RepID=UPI000F6FB6B7|nr:hypothetical protein [Cellulomonas fimi]VEH35733.1 Uncharacterised protein [Cellulomonas fimi]